MINVIDRLAAHSRQPLFRNAYALMASSGLTSVLGLVYWIVAARVYSAEAVGFNAAAIAAMMFLAGLAQLNLISALVRFVPEAGRDSRRLILAAYGISLAAALVASLVFIAGTGFWAPALTGLRSSPWLVAWFVVATMAWCIFVLEDSALTGLRKAGWVPVSNGLFAASKIALLVVLAGLAPVYGIFGSWTLALAVSLFFTNAVIFTRLVSPRASHQLEGASTVSVDAIARYLSADYVASLFWLGCTTLLPVIVTNIAGVRVNAYFFLAWQIGYGLHILSISSGSSLIVEAVLSRDELARYSRRVFWQNLRITIPLGVGVSLAAPYLLRVFGLAYAANGTTLLRLLALGAVPFSIVSLAISVARVQRRMRRVVAVLAAMCLMVLALTELLLRRMGLEGVGVAWLGTQTTLAAVVLVSQLRPLWQGDRDGLGALAYARRIRVLIRKLRFAFGARWEVDRIVSVTSDVAVLTVEDGLVLKLARTDQGEASIRRSVGVMEQLREQQRLAELHRLIPTVVAQGHRDGRLFTVEEMLPGRDARSAMADDERRPRVTRAALEAIRILHERTASTAVIDEQLVAHWVDEPVQMIRRLAERHRSLTRQLPALDSLQPALRGALIGRATTVSWVHGDFVPGNVLVAPDSDAVTGIIDWELAERCDLPVVDVVQFLLAAHIEARGGELGDLVAGLLCGSPSTAETLDMIDQERPHSSAVQELGSKELVLLSWLRHLASNLGKSRQYDDHSWWVRRNVEQVLSAVSPSSQVSTPHSHRRITRDQSDLRPIPILLYHSVTRTPSPAMASFTVSPDVFARHLDLIADDHVTMTVGELIGRLRRGEHIPEHAVVITFDDGFADNLEEAAPLLLQRRLSASVFVTTSYVAGTASPLPGPMLSWQGVHDLAAAGFEIGAHGHGHVPLDVLPIAKVTEDIALSKAMLEERLGRRVAMFAYPHGYRTRDVREAVRAAGFDGACGVRNAFSHARDDRWSLARLTVRADTSVETLAAWLGGTGAPIATRGDAPRTVAWRSLRRLGLASSVAAR